MQALQTDSQTFLAEVAHLELHQPGFNLGRFLTAAVVTYTSPDSRKEY
jgi:hypothetical protein